MATLITSSVLLICWDVVYSVTLERSFLLTEQTSEVQPKLDVLETLHISRILRIDLPPILAIACQQRLLYVFSTRLAYFKSVCVCCVRQFMPAPVIPKGSRGSWARPGNLHRLPLKDETSSIWKSMERNALPVPLQPALHCGRWIIIYFMQIFHRIPLRSGSSPR